MLLFADIDDDVAGLGVLATTWPSYTEYPGLPTAAALLRVEQAVGRRIARLIRHKAYHGSARASPYTGRIVEQVLMTPLPRVSVNSRCGSP